MDLKYNTTRLLVENFQGCFDLYSETLGFEVGWGDRQGPYADFQTGETRISINNSEITLSVIDTEVFNEYERLPNFAIVFRADSVDEAYSNLHDELEFLNEPTDHEGWGVRAVHFLDPEGRLIEINEPI